MHAVRLAVRENRLSDPARIALRDYHPYVAAKSAWVAETNGVIVGFAAAAAAEACVWALFVAPDHEKAGVGRLLHAALIDWAEALELRRLTLTTAAGTRAAGFYARLGWSAADVCKDGSVDYSWQMLPRGR